MSLFDDALKYQEEQKGLVDQMRVDALSFRAEGESMVRQGVEKIAEADELDRNADDLESR